MKKQINTNYLRKPLLGNIGILAYFLIGTLVSCQTEAPYDGEDSYSTLSAKIAYMADNDVRYHIMFGDTDFDTLSVHKMQSTGRHYRAVDEMTEKLKVWSVADDGSELLLIDSLLVLKPLSTINLIQVASGAVPELIDPELTPTDSTSTAVRFFYADALQTSGADKVKVTILAVDQYALILKSYKIANVHDTLKTVVGEPELSLGELSDPIELNVNLYGKGGINKGLSARFFYRITDAATGMLIQDYVATSSITTSAEIKVESARKNNMPYAVYKSYVMQWKYKSVALPFNSPEVLMRGEKW